MQDPAYRWDHIENDLSGARAVLTRRLITVEVKTDVPSAGTPVRTYTLWYDQEGNGQAGYRSVLTYVDVTGGYPRQIFVHAAGTAGLATQPTVPAPYSALRVTDESQEVSQTLLDMNRDGMVDLVASTTPTAWTVYVNSDGLPDWIDVVNNQWMVALNQGDGFEWLSRGTWCDWVPCGEWMCPNCYDILTAPRTWTGATGAIRKTINTGNPRYTLIDFFDVNGDGLLDRVDSSGWTTGNPNWAVKANGNVPKPNLLVSLRNGLAGTSSVFHKPSTVFDNTGGDDVPDLPFVTWVMTGLRSTDGLCTPTSEADVWNATWNLYVPTTNNCISAGDELAASVTYLDGYWDAATREFRGFRYAYRTTTELGITLTT